jgi:hypothetical protein
MRGPNVLMLQEPAAPLPMMSDDGLPAETGLLA